MNDCFCLSGLDWTGSSESGLKSAGNALMSLINRGKRKWESLKRRRATCFEQNDCDVVELVDGTRREVVQERLQGGKMVSFYSDRQTDSHSLETQVAEI